MEDWKPGFEEEKALVEWSSIGDTRAENKAIKMDKIKRLVVSKSPGCDRFRLWMVGITTTMLLRWVLSSQSGDDIGPITAKVEAPPYFPPPRDYKNQGYLMVSCNGGFLNLTLVVPVLDICVHIINNGGICKQICDMVAIARFLNLTLVVPVSGKNFISLLIYFNFA
ncbi:rhamnogalacturonan I rhamnosyltransferase 1 isoform X1 [Gossypium raimondii]|uniref:rhamnogalacturonan I rhamnosyltransferase 1 isoform X1 n=1 Tax=Gossypium raimondii TaxID=29730 RepID=UPI00063AD413|nr:rhamnogalacturonan I rhamnosyltransferase 1 isoform X1 [Gossypium raimondii]